MQGSAISPLDAEAAYRKELPGKMQYPVLLNVRSLFTRFAGLHQELLQCTESVTLLSRLDDHRDFKPIKPQPMHPHTPGIDEERRAIVIKADVQPSVLRCGIKHTKGFIGPHTQSLIRPRGRETIFFNY
jgi:hypothetical protein